MSAQPRRAIDPAELRSRFDGARGAALRDVLRSGRPAADETAALRAVPDALLDELGRRAYWNGWRLGQSAARRHGEVDEGDALSRLLDALALPCLAGGWRADGRRRRLTRAGCAAGAALGARACDFYREAIDGLVSGLSNGLRFARHASRGHGAALCEDVLYPARAPGAHLSPVPAEVAAHLAVPLARLAGLGIRIEVLGLAENRLHVELGGAHGAGCGPSKLYFDLLAEHLAKRFPSLELVDASPRAVLA